MADERLQVYRLTMLGPLLQGGKVLVTEKVSLIVPDLTCKVISIWFSHLSGNSETCFQAWHLAMSMTAVLFSKMDILNDSNEMYCHLDAARGQNVLQFFNFLAQNG